MKLPEALVAALVGLGIGVRAAQGAAPTCESGLQAYQQTLYPLQRQYCVACHGDGGIAIGHSVSDPKAAYSVTRGLIDFIDIDSSVLMTRFKQKHWLSYGGSAIPLTPDQLREQIRQWWSQGESSCPSLADFTSQALAIPASLPTRASGKYQTLSWDLGQRSGSLQGCLFQVDIQEFSPTHDSIPGSYRVRLPRIGCVGKAVSVAGLWFPVSGSVQGYENEFADVSMEVPPVAAGTDAVVLSQRYGILIERNLTSSGDTLAVMFEHLSVR